MSHSRVPHPLVRSRLIRFAGFRAVRARTQRTPRMAVALAALAWIVAAPALAQQAPAAAGTTVRNFGYEVVNTWPHSREAFTQGLLYRDGFLYESTGLNGRSSVRKVVLETGAVIRQRDVAREFFAEGMAAIGDRLIQITWQSQQGFVYDIDTFEPLQTFAYDGQGWGLAYDGKRLILSDGTDTLRFLDPEDFRETGRVQVTYKGQPLPQLNELEMVKGELFANVWGTEVIATIDPDSGRVTGRVDLRGLLSAEDRREPVDVLNGIAYDRDGDRLFVTGKLWPKLFEIRLKPLD
jgi:glutamine cyclotransferase